MLHTMYKVIDRNTQAPVIDFPVSLREAIEERNTYKHPALYIIRPVRTVHLVDCRVCGKTVGADYTGHRTVEHTDYTDRPCCGSWQVGRNQRIQVSQ